MFKTKVHTRVTLNKILSPWLNALALGLLSKVSAFASTDSPADAVPAQSGYLYHAFFLRRILEPAIVYRTIILNRVLQPILVYCVTFGYRLS